MRTISVPFRLDNGRVASTTDLREIARAQIIDVVTTAWFERVMRPNYGADVQRVLFDPMNRANLGEVRARLLDAVRSNVTIGQVATVEFPEVLGDDNRLNIDIKYTTPPDATVLSATAAISLTEGLL